MALGHGTNRAKGSTTRNGRWIEGRGVGEKRIGKSRQELVHGGGTPGLYN